MNIVVRTLGLTQSEALNLYATHRARFALYRHLPPNAEVAIRLVDINGPKGGIDKRCRIDVRGVRAETFHVEATDGDLYAAVDDACSKIAEQVRRASERRRSSLRPRQAS